jgi:hypothetical protein
MGSFSGWHWIVVLVVLGIPLMLVVALIRSGQGNPGELPNTWKFRTVVFVILAVCIPLWLITFPLFIYLAWRSYHAGEPAGTLQLEAPAESHVPPAQGPAQSKAEQVAALHELLQRGALTQAEFDIEKRLVLGG